MPSDQDQSSREFQRRYSGLLNAIIAGTSDAVYVKDAAGKYLLFNESAQSITGRRLEEVLGKDDRALFPLEHALSMMEGDRAVMAARRTETSEDRVVDADGFERVFLSTKGPLYDDRGVTIGTFGISRDITERKRMEAELQQSEERYRILVESSPDAILLHCDGLFIFANSAACSLFGVEAPAQLLGTPVMDTVPPEYREEVANRIRRTESGISNPQSEQKVLRRDGSLVEVEILSSHLTYQGRHALQVILRDITARKQAEHLLSESEQTLKNLIDAMPVGVLLVQADGSIEYMNRCFEQKVGYSLAELPSLEDWLDLACPDPGYREKVVALISTRMVEVPHKGSPMAATEAATEAAITCKDGSVRNMIFNCQLSGTRRILICTDITEREALQNELLKAQKLESLGVLAGGIAHDFNNILTGILGNISFACTFLDQSHRSFALLEQAEKAALRATELTKQLLTFAKGGVPVKRTVSLTPLLEESLSLALRGAKVQGVLHAAEALHPVEVDEGQMSQVFHNVILNAVQAMPGGGKLTVSAGNVTVGPETAAGGVPGNYVRLNFADEGDGIPALVLPKVFDPYFTTKPKGTGLGLASVHSIVSKHGGWVEVASQVGKGTELTIWLPAAGEAAQKPASLPEPVAAPRLAGQTVLVMDDEELILKVTTEMLEHLGFRVTTCQNGEQAVRLYTGARDAGLPFAAVLLDLTVPGGMGGIEAASRIRAVDPSAHLIVSSGYSNDPVMAACRAYGFSAAITKPYRERDLARILASVP